MGKASGRSKARAKKTVKAAAKKRWNEQLKKDLRIPT